MKRECRTLTVACGTSSARRRISVRSGVGRGRARARVLALRVADDELRKRILARGEGRADDTEETAKKRLEVYKRDTQPVLDHYRDQLQAIDGVGSQDDVTARLLAVLGAAS